MSEKVLNQTDKKYSTEDYLVAERRNSTKSEFIDGKVLAKSGSNRWHNLISANTAIAVGSRSHGHKCDIYVSDMRVQLRPNRFCYPDVVIVNGEPNFTDSNFDVLVNPTIIVEIFSSATNSSNKTEKLESYLAMDSIRECLMVKEDEMRVEHYAKQNPKQWIYRIYNEREDVISLDSVNCKISLQEIYAQIKFRQAEFSSKAVN
ncbi:MAG: Uma2 family endonuclease [Actinomycetota bacterium]